VQRSRVNIALFVEQPLTLAANYLSRVGVVGSVFAAVLAASTVVLPPAVAALNIGVGSCCGGACGNMLEAIARIAPLQPNEAMARIASRRNRNISLDQYCRLLISVSALISV
jgi:hypothetical protein